MTDDRKRQCGSDPRTHEFIDGADSCLCGLAWQVGGRVVMLADLQREARAREDKAARLREVEAAAARSSSPVACGDDPPPPPEPAPLRVGDEDEEAEDATTSTTGIFEMLGATPEQAAKIEVAAFKLAAQREPPDKVNPSHYDGDACMRAIAMLGYARPFCLGQAVKYLWRAGRKAGESAVDDIGKARWYLDWLRGFQTKNEADKDVVRFMLETACGAALAGELPVDKLANVVHMMQYTPEFQR